MQMLITSVSPSPGRRATSMRSRPIPNGDGSGFVSTLFRRAGMTDDRFASDRAAIEKDFRPSAIAPRYSSRSATTGSTRVARIAGM
jgi:hypothetical protein